MSQQPKKRLRRYPIEVAIWENKAEDGSTFFNVSLTRTYTVMNDGVKEYKRTHQLREQDLLVAAELLKAAWHTVRRMEDEAKARAKDD